MFSYHYPQQRACRVFASLGALHVYWEEDLHGGKKGRELLQPAFWMNCSCGVTGSLENSSAMEREGQVLCSFSSPLIAMSMPLSSVAKLTSIYSALVSSVIFLFELLKTLVVLRREGSRGTLSVPEGRVQRGWGHVVLSGVQ